MKNLRVGILFCLLIILLAALGCKKDAFIHLESDRILQIPIGFPSMIFPEGNEYTLERWQLGKKLFFDPIMSRSNTISCASCHMPQFAFSDTSTLSKGEHNLQTSTNSPSLTNIGYHPYFTRAGGARSLEIQVNVPIQEHNEFDMQMDSIITRVKKIPAYVAQSQAAYNRAPDAYVITRAIANFERSLISGNSRYDKHEFQGYAHALTENEKRGQALFFSQKTNCSSCHSGFNFTSYAFENNGLHLKYVDSGRMRLSKLETDRDRFKVPSLRNIELTSPYMHDGSLKTLEAVVAHYNTGGKIHKNKNTNLIKPLGLNKQEQADLVAFLKALTDKEFVTKEKFRNEK